MRLLTTFAVLSVLAFAASASDVTDCACNESPFAAARAPALNISGPALPNIALSSAALSLALLGPSPDFDASPGAAHKIAAVAAAVYDARAFATGKGAVLTRARAESPAVLEGEREEFVGYAAYFALVKVLDGEEGKLAMLHSRMWHLGYRAAGHTEHAVVPGVKAVLLKYGLKMPMGLADGVNAASAGFDAECAALKDGGQWQAQCVQMKPGMMCMPQKVPFRMLFNATLMAAAGGSAGVYAAQAAAPPVWKGGADLSGLRAAEGGDEFADGYREVLAVSGQIGDAEKVAAEFFQPPAFVTTAVVALQEAVARGLGEAESAALMFAVSAAARDAVAAAVTLKLTDYATRPVTVLQCGYAGEKMSAWNAPYQGVREFVNGEDGETWRPYLQTPPFPGWVSGHATVAAAGAEVMEAWFGGEGGVRGANCKTVGKGKSKFEPMVLKGAAGWVRGVTDVPNTGSASVGYSPAEDVTICWASFTEFAEKLKNSRLVGGIHIAKDNDDGAALGKIVGKAAYEYVTSIYQKEAEAGKSY